MLRCTENAMRQEEQMLDRQQERDKAAAETTENARFLNIRKLVWEFNRMHRRFNQVEDMAKRLRIESKVLPHPHINVAVFMCARAHAPRVCSAIYQPILQHANRYAQGVGENHNHFVARMVHHARGH